MKLFIYLVAIGLLVYYLGCYKKKENYTNIPGNFDGTNQYQITLNPQSKTFVIDGNSDLLSGYDYASDIYQTKPWYIKSTGFSDIFNYEDNASNIIYNQVNIPSGFDPEKVKQDNLKILADLKTEVDVSEENKTDIPQIVDFENKKFSLVGSASNPYYYQYYLLYEKKVNNDELLFLDNQVYEYLLVKMNKFNPEIAHHVGPRVKINLNDTIYLALGNFQIGPLIIKSLKK